MLDKKISCSVTDWIYLKLASGPQVPPIYCKVELNVCFSQCMCFIAWNMVVFVVVFVVEGPSCQGSHMFRPHWLRTIDHL